MKYKDIMYSVIFIGVICIAVKCVRADDGFGFDSMEKYQVCSIWIASVLIFGFTKKIRLIQKKSAIEEALMSIDEKSNYSFIKNLELKIHYDWKEN